MDCIFCSKPAKRTITKLHLRDLLLYHEKQTRFVDSVKVIRELLKQENKNLSVCDNCYRATLRDISHFKNTDDTPKDFMEEVLDEE